MFHQGKGDPVALLKWKGRARVWPVDEYREGPVTGQGQPVGALMPSTVVDVIGGRATRILIHLIFRAFFQRKTN